MPGTVEGDENNLYLVENIVDRRVKRGRVEYRVRWKGFPPEQDSWEPFTNLRDPCLSLIQEFHNRKILGLKRRATVPTVPASKSSNSTKTINRSSSTNSSTPEQSSYKVKTESLTKFEKNQMGSQPISSATAARTSLSDSLGGTNLSDQVPNTTDASSDPVTFNSSSLITTPFVDNDVRMRSLSTSLTTTDRLGGLHSDIPHPSYPATDGTHSTTSSTTSTTSSKARRSKPVDLARFKLSSPAKKTPQSAAPKSKPTSLFKSSSASSVRNTPKQVKPEEDLSVNETSLESHRKSVKIMLKASPTQEFQNTQTLQLNHSPGTGLSQSSKRRSEPTKKPAKNKIPQPPAAVTLPIVQLPPQSVPDSNLAKVMDIVLQMKESRRRPVQSVVFAACEKQYNLNEPEVLAALNFLVASGQLHEIPFTNGISYRSNPYVVARGDLSHPATTHALSARIKAKYASGLKQKKKHKPSRVVPPATMNGGVKRRIYQTFPTAPNPSSKRPRSDSLKHVSSFPRSNHVQNALGSLNSKMSLLSKSKHDCDATLNGGHLLTNSENQSKKSQCEARIFVVPPASPVIESNFEMRFKNLPHRRMNQSEELTDSHFKSGNPTHHDPLPGSFADASNPFLEITDSVQTGTTVPPRRVSVRQSAAATRYKFKSIYVKRNEVSSFTEIWLQSPASPMKNAFTIQVLEELTAVLNHAVYDSSRLIMICGMGTVFGSGIDLTHLTGPFHRSINSSRASSSASSVCSCNGAVSTRIPDPSVSLASAELSADPKETNPADTVTMGCFHCSSSVNPIPDMTRKVTAQTGGLIGGADPIVCQQLCAALRAFLLALVAFPKPIVVGVNGPAMGLAVAMLPLCDLVYASDSATFQLPYTRLGQTPEGGSSFTLAALIGLPLANELLLVGRKLSAREAAQRGFVSDILYPKSFKQELIMRCQQLALASPSALEMTKCIIRTQQRDRIEFVINTECRKLVELWQTVEFRKSAINFLSRGMEDFI